MPDIRLGQIFAFYLFDVAETVDLAAVPALIGGPTVAARLAPKSATPAYVQYEKPPVSFDGELIGVADVAGFHPRFRIYDYGVISLALSRPFSGDWNDLVTLGQELIESDQLELLAEQHCRDVVERLRSALADVRSEFLSEDYLVFVVNELG